MVTGAKQEPSPGANAEENPGNPPGGPFQRFRFLRMFLADDSLASGLARRFFSIRKHQSDNYLYLPLNLVERFGLFGTYYSIEASFLFGLA